MLGALKELMGIDSFLLATEKTNKCVGELQSYLAKKGVSNVKIITPSRIHSTSRSRHGQRALISTSRATKQPQGLFRAACDPQLQRQKTREHEGAVAALSHVQNQRDELERKIDSADQVVAHADARYKEILRRFAALRKARERIAPLKQRVDKARKECDDYDADAMKRKYREEFDRLHRGVMAVLTKMMLSLRESESARIRLNAARLALKAAECKLDESENGSEQLRRQVAHGEIEVKDLKNHAAAMARQLVDLEQRAKEKAAHLKPCDTRSDADTAIWDSLPSEASELEAEMEALESETSTETADGKSVTEFKERLKKIDDCKARLAVSGAECDAKGASVKALEEQWKPALAEMIETVDSSFASYFRRFNCMGGVSLADGQKLDENGEPCGEDDFSDYKLHIKVKWRDNEELHVLGQDGRDSGGERSVATMVYLISLQNINPAPFRVVDEINQAMDSSNERNIFECITSACRDMGKQYFLLTPKLLPDLDYGENCVIQLVFNGPYMPSADTFDLANYCA